MQRATFHPLTVSAVEELTDDARVVTFAVPAELREDYRYQAGQHLTLRAPGGERRSYSICAPVSAYDAGTLRVAVKRLSGGAVSTWVHDELAAGDVVDVMTPQGHFTCEPDPDAARHHLAVAAGSGITPVLSLLSTALETEPLSRATLLYGNRRTSSVMFLEELQDLKDKYGPRFHLVHVFSREPQDVELFTGRLDGDRLARILDALVPVDTVDEWYLCGPFEMVTAARDLLGERGVDARHVHLELFHVEAEPPARSPEEEALDEVEATVTVTLDGRTTQIPMPSRTESVLDATLRVRPDAPFSCTGGVCGTCRVRVVSGTVRMDRNYALEPDEVARGVVLACQAHPTSDEVVVSYD